MKNRTTRVKQPVRRRYNPPKSYRGTMGAVRTGTILEEHPAAQGFPHRTGYRTAPKGQSPLVDRLGPYRTAYPPLRGGGRYDGTISSRRRSIPMTVRHASIPTTYKRINFRSRLEARYAVLFDQLGWRWDYGRAR